MADFGVEALIANPVDVCEVAYYSLRSLVKNHAASTSAGQARSRRMEPRGRPQAWSRRVDKYGRSGRWSIRWQGLRRRSWSRCEGMHHAVVAGVNVVGQLRGDVAFEHLDWYTCRIPTLAVLHPSLDGARPTRASGYYVALQEWLVSARVLNYLPTDTPPATCRRSSPRSAGSRSR